MHADGKQRFSPDRLVVQFAAMRHLIATHAARPSDDPIFALNQEATARRSRGESIVNATVGALLSDDGTLAILPSAHDAITRVPAAEWATYAPIAGSGPFLSAIIADVLGTEKALADASVAVATPGGTGALRHAIANFLEPGQALLTSSFYWGPYATLADENERRVDTYNMFTPSGGYDLAALDSKVSEHLATQGRALLFLNDPCNNPTGYSLSDGEWTDLVNILDGQASRGPVTALIDVAYYTYAAGDPRRFVKKLVHLLGKVPLLFAWSGSKAFTHYGLRVGGLIATVSDASDRTAVQSALTYSCRGTWSNCNRGGLYAVTQLLADPELAARCESDRTQLRELLLRRVVAFNAEAAKRGLLYPRYEGGFFVTVFHPDAYAKAERMKARGVFVVPQKGALRVALCAVAEHDVVRLVDSLAED